MVLLYGAQLGRGNRRRPRRARRKDRGTPISENKMSEDARDYEVGRGKPPMHRRFKKG
jgi:hypothetical protein